MSLYGAWKTPACSLQMIPGFGIVSCLGWVLWVCFKVHLFFKIEGGWQHEERGREDCSIVLTATRTHAPSSPHPIEHLPMICSRETPCQKNNFSCKRHLCPETTPGAVHLRPGSLEEQLPSSFSIASPAALPARLLGGRSLAPTPISRLGTRCPRCP